MQNKEGSTVAPGLSGPPVSPPTELSGDIVSSNYRRAEASDMHQAGLLVVNADDWGRDSLTTNRVLECSVRGAVSSVSAMVFMADSERAAALAREHGIEAGLHLNFVTPFSASGCPSALLKHQGQLAHYLLRNRFAQIIFHPGLMRSFEHVVAAQIDEFRKLYGAEPSRLDGHHHMHLCANVLGQRLLPSRAMVRRSLSFEQHEKSLWNRLYRHTLDRRLARRHQLVDYFFSLAPLEPPNRLQRVYSLARQFIVEMMVHPINRDEYHYLMAGEMLRHTGHLQRGAPSAVFKSPITSMRNSQEH